MTFARCTWLNEPAEWALDGSDLTVTTDAKTDFWRETHYVLRATAATFSAVPPRATSRSSFA